MRSASRLLAALVAFGGAALLFVASARAALVVSDPAAEIGFSALGGQGALAFLVMGGAALVEAPLPARLGWKRGRLRGAAPLVAVLGFVAASAALDGALDLSGWRAVSRIGALDRVLGSAHGATVVLVLLGLVAAPPVCEELLFRGLLQPRLVHGLGPVAGVTLTALLFGVSHLDPVHAAGAFGLGLYLGVVALLDGGIWTAILCHAANNALAVGAALLPIAEPGISGGWRVSLGLAAAGLALETARRSARRTGAGLQRPDSRAVPGALDPRGACR